MSNIGNPEEQLRSIEEKKEALTTAIYIATNIERMERGLHATLLMGKPTSRISKDIIERFEELDGNTKLLPSDRLKEILTTLEKTIQVDFKVILKLSRARNFEQALTEMTRDVNLLMKNFSKCAQTAVVIRVLLSSRDVLTQPIEIEVSERELQERLCYIREKEKECRVRVHDHITGMQGNIRDLLRQPGTPEGMKVILEGSLVELEFNLKHLDSGKAIASMPYVVEVMEARGLGSFTVDNGQADALDKEVVPGEETCSEETTRQSGTEPVRRGIFQIIREWFKR
ncbi:MAG: hypothetical protein BMS9Abin26_0783 [Gammaproteobacteria bacterium]|nr:MAG: hypothetical protein BMS9Abin26_0783 [Gammaproteobacteria bacterium]